MGSGSGSGFWKGSGSVYISFKRVDFDFLLKGFKVDW